MVSKYFATGMLFVLAVSSALAAEKAPGYAACAIPMSERPCTAIVSFDDGSIQREKWWGPGWDVGSGLADILTTSILSTNRFRLLERSLLKQVTAEQDLGASSRVDPSKAAKLGRVIGADYLIMGRVTEFAWETRRAGGIGDVAGRLVGLKQSVTKARVAVDIHIVDADTSEIVGKFHRTRRGEPDQVRHGRERSWRLCDRQFRLYAEYIGRGNQKGDRPVYGELVQGTGPKAA